MAIGGLRELGLTSDDFAARVSDRRLLSALLEVIGVPEGRMAAAFTVIDKIERMPKDKATATLESEVGLERGQNGTLLGPIE